MQVLLLGASGFIGSHIAAHLIQTGHHITAVTRFGDNFANRYPNVKTISADITKLTSPDDWLPHLDGIDAVINCAGLLQAPSSTMEKLHHLAPAALFAAAAALKINKIIQLSILSIDADTTFARSKRAGDEALQKLDCDWTIFRPSLVYGPSAHGANALLRALAACPFAIPMLGKGKQSFTPINIADLVKTVTIALTTDRLSGKIIAPCGPEHKTLAEMARSLRSWLGLPPAAILALPRFFIALICRIGDVLEHGPLRTTTLRQIDHGNQANPQEFSQITGFTPQSFTDNLTASPSGTGDLWQARLYLARPLVTLSLAMMWILSGYIGLTTTPGKLWPLLYTLPIQIDLSISLINNVSLINIFIGIMVLISNRPRLLFWLQSFVIITYTTCLTLMLPALWLDLFSALLKNLPLLALVLLHRIIQIER